MWWRGFVLGLGVVGLAACGGTSIPVDQLAPTSVSFNSVVRLVGDETAGVEAQLTAGGIADTYDTPVNVPELNSAFHSFRNEDGSGYALLARTASGAGLVMTTTNIPWQLERLTPTPKRDEPVSYAGPYAGQYERVVGGTSFGHMIGQARVDLDFGTETFDARISERENSGGLEAEDVVFRSVGSLAGRSLSLNVDGGAFVGGSGGTGQMRIITVGSEGQEVIGAVTISHELNGARYRENGGFIGQEIR